MRRQFEPGDRVLWHRKEFGHVLRVMEVVIPAVVMRITRKRVVIKIGDGTTRNVRADNLRRDTEGNS